MRAVRYAVAALAATCLLGACSEPDPEMPRVASFQSETPAARASAAPGDEGVLVPLDATTEERDAAWNQWNACVIEKGGPSYAKDVRLLSKKDGHGDPAVEKVVAACRSKRPETYEERQKRTDLAAFRDNQRQWYECAKKQGYKVTAADENGEFGITEVGPNGDFQSPKMDKCRQDAFKD